MLRASGRGAFARLASNRMEGGMGTIPTKSDWKYLRETKYGIKKGRAKASVGAALEAYHKASTSKDKIEKLKAVDTALRNYMKALDPKNKEEKKFIGEIGEIIKKVKARNAKLEGYRKLETNTLSLSLDQVLKSKKLMKSFHAYCKSELNDNELEFVVFVDKGASKEALYKNYVSDAGAKQVNLPSGVKKPLDQLAPNYNQMDFSAARKSIAKMLSLDALTRYKKSKELEKLVAEMSGTTLKD